MRKSVAITAAPSSTCTAVSPSTTNHSSSRSASAASVSGNGSTSISAATRRLPGARACHSVGNSSAMPGSKGRTGRPGVKLV